MIYTKIFNAYIHIYKWKTRKVIKFLYCFEKKTEHNLSITFKYTKIMKKKFLSKYSYTIVSFCKKQGHSVLYFIKVNKETHPSSFSLPNQCLRMSMSPYVSTHVCRNFTDSTRPFTVFKYIPCYFFILFMYIHLYKDLVAKSVNLLSTFYRSLP